MSDVEAMKERQRRVWGLGDYAVLARPIEPAATALCDACAVSAGQEVLDVGAGTGNFALACAREGASVVASDLSPAMVEKGRARTEAEGYDVEWVEADVEALPFEDGRFDCAGSTFGAFIAPRPEVASAELFRVVRPGGTVGLTAWTPDDFFGELSGLGQSFSPVPEGSGRPQEWGDEATARARLEPLASRVDCERHTLAIEAESPEALAAMFADNAPPYAAARETLPDEQYSELVSETAELARRWNTAGDGTVRVEPGYLVIVARKRG
jgi:ubiquinone/menaquinone biosynthesis C-methylase UbiE